MSKNPQEGPPLALVLYVGHEMHVEGKGDDFALPSGPLMMTFERSSQTGLWADPVHQVWLIIRIEPN